MRGYDDFGKVLDAVKDSEIIVGIPSRNSAHTIGYVLKNVDVGLRRYLSDKNSFIVVCDGLSNDGTVEVVNVFKKYLKTPLAIIPNTKSRGKGGAVKTILEVANESSALEALVLVDSDLRSIVPEWIPLLSSVTEGYGLAVPYYRRHKYDGTITNFVARPLTTMAYGLDINQPIGGDFGLSRELVRILSNSELWSKIPWTMLFGVDILITHTALAHGLSVCEVDLGVKIHEPKDPATSLKGMFIEVLGTIFELLIEYSELWSEHKVCEISFPKRIEKFKIPRMNPWEIVVSKEKAYNEFIKGLAENKSFLETYLSKETLTLLYSEETKSKGVTSKLWATIVYEFFKHYLNLKGEKEEALKSLFSIWQGRLYNYYIITWNMDDKEAFKEVDKQIKDFIELRRLFTKVFA